MDLGHLLGLAATDHPLRWRQIVSSAVCTPAGALQGGAALAAAIEATQASAQRPVRWATGQYLSHVAAQSVVDLEVSILVNGPHLSQARCTMRCDEVEILLMMAALGTRPFAHEAVWPRPPQVPSPADCPERAVPGASEGTLLEMCERRAAQGRSYPEVDGKPGPGRSATWIRLPGGARMVSAGDLALVGDFLMVEFTDALGVACTGNSLDNTVRVARLVTTEWILLDAHIQTVTGGLGYGMAHLWAEDGTLLGTASQTLALRTLEPDGTLPSRRRRIVGRDATAASRPPGA